MNWIIDGGHTIVEFSVKHLMISTVKGRFNTVSGTVVFDPDNRTTSEIDVIIDAASINTNEENRDRHLKSPDMFDVTQYPNITFKSTQVETIGNENIKVVGDLTIHGVTKSVDMDVVYAGQTKNHFGGSVAVFSAKTVINRRDFGLNWNAALEAGGVVLGEKVNINLEVEIKAQSPAIVAV